MTIAVKSGKSAAAVFHSVDKERKGLPINIFKSDEWFSLVLKPLSFNGLISNVCTL